MLCLALSCEAAIVPQHVGARSPSMPAAIASTPTLLLTAAPLRADEEAVLARRSAATLARRPEKAGASNRTKVVWIVVGVTVVGLAIYAASTAESVNNMQITVNP